MAMGYVVLTAKCLHANLQLHERKLRQHEFHKMAFADSNFERLPASKVRTRQVAQRKIVGYTSSMPLIMRSRAKCSKPKPSPKPQTTKPSASKATRPRPQTARRPTTDDHSQACKAHRPWSLRGSAQPAPHPQHKDTKALGRAHQLDTRHLRIAIAQNAHQWEKKILNASFPILETEFRYPTDTYDAQHKKITRTRFKRLKLTLRYSEPKLFMLHSASVNFGPMPCLDALTRS